mmetsp:Transcript_29871/g.41273  ORF Transcript_29871/g.41273 Transcript_29871/m.41273 type:complete len:276 (+) Transcript_29871:37-864(+)
MWSSVSFAVLLAVSIAFVYPDVAPPRTVAFDDLYRGNCGGTGGCLSSNQYVCLDNFPGDFNNGIATFEDFIGNTGGEGTVSEIDIAMIGTSGCDTLGTRTFQWFLNGQSLGTTSLDVEKDNCECTAPCDATPPSIQATGTIPYNFSGLNQISVSHSTPQTHDGCYFEYQFNLTYTLGPPLTCCLYNATNVDDQKTFCSPNSNCPVLNDFINVASGQIKSCDNCNTKPVCCLYQSVTNSSDTTAQCLGPLSHCSSMSGYTLEGDFQIDDCSFCKFD